MASLGAVSKIVGKTADEHLASTGLAQLNGILTTGSSNPVAADARLTGSQKLGVMATHAMVNAANSSYTAMSLGGAAIGGVYGGITGGLSDSDTAISKGLSDGIAGGFLGAGVRFGAKRYAEGAAMAFKSSGGQAGVIPGDLKGIQNLDGFVTDIGGKFQVATDSLYTSLHAGGGNSGFSFSHFGTAVTGNKP